MCYDTCTPVRGTHALHADQGIKASRCIHAGDFVSAVMPCARMQCVRLHVTLALIYLACVALQQPITPSDIVRAALEGRLPYLRMPDR